MMYVSEQFNHRVWLAFSRLIEKRYNRSIRFSPAMNALDLGKEFIVSKSGDLMVPLMAQSQFLGCILVKQGGSMETESMREIQGIIEKIGSVLLDINSSAENEKVVENLLLGQKKHLISLVGGELELRRKVASRIQDILGSWSMLPWADAGMAQWNTDDMSSLSDICIFIPELSELSPLERQHLTILAKLPETMRPHLILCSSKPLSEGVRNHSVEPELASLFASSSLFIDQLPQEPLRLKEVLEMLLIGTRHLQLDGKSLV